ncbi:hypothetical protein N9H93_02700 [Rhizobiaceae bacterium]|nr:hypothetical protein [Rhizobiaceae bacterium]
MAIDNATLLLPTRSPNLMTKQVAAEYGGAKLADMTFPPMGLKASVLIEAVSGVLGHHMPEGVPMPTAADIVVRTVRRELVRYRIDIEIDRMVQATRRTWRTVKNLVLPGCASFRL